MKGDLDLISAACFVGICLAVGGLVLISFNDNASMAFNEGLYVVNSFFDELCGY